MADHVSSDHPSVHTVRATLTETTTGYKLEIPEDDREQFTADEVVRIVLEDDELYARVERALTGETLSIPGVYETPGVARDPREGVDRLSAWVSERNVRAGGSVLVDVVEPDFLYGLRKPGETAVYTAREPPSDSLAAIADDLEES